MLVSRFNPPLRCVKTLKAKTLYTWRDGRPNLPYSSRAIEVENEKTLIEVPLSFRKLDDVLYTLFQLAAAVVVLGGKNIVSIYHLLMMRELEHCLEVEQLS